MGLSSRSFSPAGLARDAEQHLRAIRGLMERAVHYRVVSAETAAVGGGLALGAGAFSLYREAAAAPLGEAAFYALWLSVLTLTLAANAGFLAWSAWQRGEEWLSSRLRLAVASAAPPLLATAVLTAWLMPAGDLGTTAVLWQVGYGLALLATSSFAPRSLQILGWSFLLTGLLLPFCLQGAGGTGLQRLFALGSLTLSFGWYHLAYAAWVGWQEIRAAAAAPARPAAEAAMALNAEPPLAP